MKTSSTQARHIHLSRTVIDSGGKRERSRGWALSTVWALRRSRVSGPGASSLRGGFFGTGFSRFAGKRGASGGLLGRFGRWLRLPLRHGKSLYPGVPEISRPRLRRETPIRANVRIYARAVPFRINPHRCVMPAHSRELFPGQSSLLPLHSARHAADVRVKPHPHGVPGGKRPPHRSAARRACRTSLLQTRSNTPHYRSS